MGLKMQPEIVSREIIKPAPKNHPAIHNLSFFDQISPSMYVPLLFFYTSKKGDTDGRKSSVLKTSLSEALSHYYPLAGRIKDNVTVDCNDKGALFLEAQMECDLSEFLMNYSDDVLRVLFPNSLCWKDSSSMGPIAVQVTYFKCGGMSIGICLCHKLMEMASMSSFIYDWASIARDPERKIVYPEFSMGSLYPPIDISITKEMFEPPREMNGCISRRLVFGGSKIDELKAMAADQVPNPTRVEVVTALVYKSAIKAAAKANSIKSSVMNHVINIRAHVSPPIPKINKGNAAGIFSVKAPENIEDPRLGLLVEHFRHSKTKFAHTCSNASNGEEVCLMTLKSLIPNVEHDMYICTSWCRNPFYECDFGWGKPLWVATIWLKRKNAMCLIDTREGDGIEVFIGMEEKVMALMEHDQELLSFSNFDPIVL